jgi:hypothetical protein
LAPTSGAGQAYDWRWGYPVVIPGGASFGAAGDVTVWLKFSEAQRSWENPVILI